MTLATCFILGMVFGGVGTIAIVLLLILKGIN